MAMTKLLSCKNDLHVELAFEAMATLPTLELAVERLKDQHGITTTPQILEGLRRFYPERYQKVHDESAPAREAYLVEGMIHNARLATEAEVNAIRRADELLESGKAQDPSRIGRDLADR